MKILEKEMSERDLQKISEVYSKDVSSSIFQFILYFVIIILFNFHFTELGYSKYIFNIPIYNIYYPLLKKSYRATFF